MFVYFRFIKEIHFASTQHERCMKLGERVLYDIGHHDIDAICYMLPLSTYKISNISTRSYKKFLDDIGIFLEKDKDGIMYKFFMDEDLYEMFAGFINTYTIS